MYGIPETNPIRETHPTNPISFHGVEKLTVEKYLAVLRRHGLNSVVVRPANVYGTYQDPWGRLGFIAVALGRILCGEEVVVWGDGTVVRDYTHVDDVCRALLHVGLHSTAQHVYNVGSGIGVSIRDLLDAITSVTARRVHVTYHPKRSVDVPTNILAIDRLARESGWAPSISLMEGMQTTWDWVQAIGATNRAEGFGRCIK